MPSRIPLADSLVATISIGLLASSASAADFFAIRLVTDDLAAHPARLVDSALIDPRGFASSTTGPFCVGDAATGLATFYTVDPTTHAPSKSGSSLNFQGNGRVTGVSFKSAGTGFNGDSFLFSGEDGTLSGWRGALGTVAEVLRTASPANRYSGSTFGLVGTSPYLYSANFQSGTIDVLDGNLQSAFLSGHFLDPILPSGYAPFNVQNLGGKLYVAYAVRDVAGQLVKGPGNGIVDAFDLNGVFLARVATGDVLDAPWGLAIAPSSFGPFAGHLLVGNFGDGTIHAYDLSTNTRTGTLASLDSTPIVIDGLRALGTGNGGNGGDPQSLYFTAGPGGGTHGLLGVITALPEPGVATLLGAGLIGLVGAVRSRKRSVHRRPAPAREWPRSSMR
ncbi:MAG: TIGR03118 family protein [Myxococcota bacterium]